MMPTMKQNTNNFVTRLKRDSLLSIVIPYVGSGAKSEPPCIPKREGDVKNWRALWNVLHDVQSRTNKNLTTFERIILANAEQRGKYSIKSARILVEWRIYLSIQRLHNNYRCESHI